jgi:hypothetical protein
LFFNSSARLVAISSATASNFFTSAAVMPAVPDQETRLTSNEIRPFNTPFFEASRQLRIDFVIFAWAVDNWLAFAGLELSVSLVLTAAMSSCPGSASPPLIEAMTTTMPIARTPLTPQTANAMTVEAEDFLRRRSSAEG